eukprot:15349028-Ditylum_brightwellii.AAC.1
MELKENYLLPGQRVCSDHYHYAEPGCTYNSRGATGEANMYIGEYIFVDNASGLVHIENQSIRISGAGAAHQNEGTISEKLCPMKMDHAAWLFNRIPKWNPPTVL